jgi:transposase
VKNVSADMGYLSRENLRAIVEIGAVRTIPFKVNSVADDKDELWTRLLAFYTFNRPQFDAVYHRRSLTESTFSSIKRVLGANVKAKSPEGQFAEVYLNVLCHNIRVLVQSMHELGVTPQFWSQPSAGAA